MLDNLIAEKAIPAMIGIFVDPGVFPGIEDARKRRNRIAEYDAFDARYADFLIGEVLPLAAELVPISDDPQQRGLCGHSSGGNAAFSAAWHRPDAFGKVIGFSSSFAQMPGGNPHPQLMLVLRKPLGHRPAAQDAALLEPQVEVRARAAVVVEDEAGPFRHGHDSGHS